MGQVTKATEIKNARIQFVSLVDKAANRREFLMKKAKDGRAEFTSYGRIVKTDSENHYVTGIVYEPMTEDSHGDFMSEGEITKAAYYFAKKSNKIDIQYSFETFKGASVVETWIAKANFKIGSEEIQKGSWLMTVEVSDKDIWDKIEKGEITGFSMGGIGEYGGDDVNLNSVNKADEKKGLLSKLAETLGLKFTEKSFEPIETRAAGISKAGKKMSGKNRETLACIYESLGTFLKEFDEESEKEPDDDTNDKTADEKKEEKEVTKSEVESIVTDAVKKAFENNTAKETQPQESEITAESIQKMVDTAIQKALHSKEESKTVTAEQVAQMIEKAVSEAVEPIRKSAGIPNNLNSEGNVEKAGQHYLHGIL